MPCMPCCVCADQVEETVQAERVRAVKEAAQNLAEAQLMDVLFSDAPSESRWPKGYTPVPGRAPLRRRKSKKKQAQGARSTEQ